MSEISNKRGTDSARVIQVIETRSLAGSGTQEDPYYTLVQYWDFEGHLLAKNDPSIEVREF